MEIRQKHLLKFEKANESILIPYMKEEGIEKEWLKRILPLNYQFPIDEWIQNNSKPVIQVEDTWVQIEFLPIIREKASLVEDLKEAFGAFGKRNQTHCQIVCEQLVHRGIETQELIQLMVQAMLEGAYRFRKEYLIQVTTENIFEMREKLTDEKEAVELTLILAEDCEEAIQIGKVYGKAINRARTIANIPNNYLHVKDFTAYAKQLAAYYELDCQVLGKDELEALHSGGILSVNAGSNEEANLIVLKYKGNSSDALEAVIGKGVMFDAGGYHLKSLDGMDGMKYDMCGSANVLAVIEVIASLKCKTNLMVVIPAVENVISPDATKMGDVITTMSGKTVEIYNTDAEGRLILCDALTYAIREGATRLIDLATLTYSCQGALGTEVSGIFANSEAFYEAFIKQANKTGEKIWRLPLDPVYHKVLKNTQTADLMNYAPGYAAGASVAACFLEEFIEKDLPWIHLDVVGTAVCRSEQKDKAKGATGVLISTIASLIQQ